MAQIFLSYSHSDSDFVELIEPRIERIFGEGLLWYDRKPDGLKGGQIWWNEILREIQYCQIFLFLLSDESAKSEWCSKELEEAVSLNKTLIPVLLEAYSSKGYPDSYSEDILRRLEETHYVDLRNSHNRVRYDDLSELWGAINRSQRTSLSRTERWMLWNQHEILKMLKFGKEHQQMDETIEQQVLSSGIEFHYKGLIFFNEIGIGFNDGQEARMILDMFLALHVAVELERNGYKKQELDLTNEQFELLKFRGYLTNYEQSHAAYTYFLISNSLYFPEIFSIDRKYDSLREMLPVYRRMLIEWQQSRDTVELSKEDVIRIATVATQ